jgi:ribosomal protein S18 acetylase RimI-like enzyme
MQKLRIVVPDTSYATPISELIVSLMEAFVVPGADLSQFLDSLSPAAEAGYLRDARYWYRIALVDDDFAGVIALRDHSHLLHLFVKPRLQRQGIGLALWQEAVTHLRQARTQAITLRSAPDAIGFYEKLGFQREGGILVTHGVRVQPMRLMLVPLSAQGTA